MARLRTRVHPTAALFPDVPAYDELYERADSFDELYETMAADLLDLATSSASHHVVFAVPGSPVVAERTVEILLAQSDVRVDVLPAVSVIDIACARLGVDPMAQGVRVVDAHSTAPLRGPGPLLILQAHSRAVLAVVADRLTPTTPVTVLHHLGLPDEAVVTVIARELPGCAADHLTSLWVRELRTSGDAMDDLEDLATTLRARCAWDQEQTVATLGRHLLEESYEALDALGVYASDPSAVAHVVEELGDLLYQVVAQAELGREVGDFALVDVINAVTTKLVDRHPHVFGDAVVTTATDAAAQWERIKRVEKKRTSATDGIPAGLPALALFEKLRRHADAVGVVAPTASASRHRVRGALEDARTDADSIDDSWVALARALGDFAHSVNVDLEMVMRAAAHQLRDEITVHEHNVIDQGEHTE